MHCFSVLIMRRKREKPEEVARSYVKTKKDRDGFLVQQVPLKGNVLQLFFDILFMYMTDST